MKQRAPGRMRRASWIAASGLLSAVLGGAHACAAQSQAAAPAAGTSTGAAAPADAAAAVPAANLSPVFPSAGAPIAIVPLTGGAGAAPTVTGALEVTGDKAIIAASGAVTSGKATTKVTLPQRGVLSVCAATTVKLAADTSVPKGEIPGLLMAMDHGAMEADVTAGRNSDMVLTPDFRILISGPGKANLKVRLGKQGDTCVDNSGIDAPYVLVTSLFGDGVYRVQPGQRVMFERGSIHDVVDQEKEPCGCPAPVKPSGNEFPLAQSEGLEPLAEPAPGPPPGAAKTPTHLALVYNSAEHAPKPAPAAEPVAPQAGSGATAPEAPKAAQKPKHKVKRGFFRSIGRFFRRVFGAE